MPAQHRKIHVAQSELGVEIFEPRGPVRTQRNLDAAAGHPPASPYDEFGLNRPRIGGDARWVRRTGDLRSGELVVGPGQPAGCIHQPRAWRVADAATYRVGELQHLLIG